MRQKEEMQTTRFNSYTINSSTSLRSNRMKETKMKLIRLKKYFLFFFSSVDEKSRETTNANINIILKFNKKVYDKCSLNYIKQIFRRKRVRRRVLDRMNILDHK